MKPFEDDLLRMIENIKFRNVNDEFLTPLLNDQKKINNSPNIFVFADKARNIYETTTETYKKLLNDNVTTSYKVHLNETMKDIDGELKSIASSLSIASQIEPMAKLESFLSLKDHKENFQNDPKCGLINPAKSEIGKMIKSTLDRINTSIRSQT